MNQKTITIISVLILILIGVNIAMENPKFGGQAGISEQKAGEGKAAIGGAFTLTNQKGETVSDTAFRGTYMLVYFGFTNCPMICPTDVNLISEAMKILESKGKAADVQPLFITVDPARDTPEQIAGFLANFYPGFIGLTGTEEALKQVKDAYKVYAAKMDEPNAKDSYLMDHSAFTYLMDRDGAYVMHFSHETPADQMAEKILGAIQ